MKNLNYLNRYFWKYRGRLVLGTFFIVLANLFNVYAPILVGEGVDFLVESLSAVRQIKTTGLNASVETPSSLQALIGMEGALPLTIENYTSSITTIGLWLALGYVVMFALKGVFLFYQRQTIIVMSRHIEYDLKNEIYSHYQKLDTSFYKSHRTGDLMNRISEDVNRVRMYLGPAVMYTINLVVLIVMCIVVMMKIDIELTLYTLSPLPFMMIGIFYVSQIINKKTDRVQQQQSLLSTMVQESFSGIRVLKAFHRENYFVRRFTEESNDYKKKQLQLVKTDALFMPVILVLVGLSTLLTLYVGANKVMTGEITYGTIVQFVFYVNQLTWPFASVGWVSSLVQKAEASQARINEFLTTESKLKNGTLPITQAFEHLSFHDVSFTYPESGVQAVKNVSFELHAGETVGIIGRTGSGKTTLTQLLIRLYDPTSGEIRVNGKNVRSLDLNQWRDKVRVVPQDVFLFSDTIENNIRFGTATSTFEEVEIAAKRADIHSTIIGFPQGYKTLLGERGINLSGGQKQRVSLARAFIKEPEVLLLDDSLSALDTQTEDTILTSLHTASNQGACLIIAHRISSIKNADRILVMDNGSIIESGTHESLIALGGEYASIFRLQQLEREQ